MCSVPHRTRVSLKRRLSCLVALPCSAWDQILNRLERGPEAVGTTLDWAIKLPVFRDRARRRGFDWDVLPAWTQVADLLEPARLAARTAAQSLNNRLLDADGPLSGGGRDRPPAAQETRSAPGAP